jgi:uncharacterized protein YndB with AHSA1/START domain
MTDHTSTSDAVVIERTVDATPEQIWSMWTDPDQFRQWYGPTGATIPEARFDLRTGGERVVAMTVETPDGERTFWFRGEHLEIEPHRVLGFTEAMTDAAGREHSPVTIVRVELEQLDNTTTRLRLTHHGIPGDSPGAMGWQMALDKLEARLQTS